MSAGDETPPPIRIPRPRESVLARIERDHEYEEQRSDWNKLMRQVSVQSFTTLVEAYRTVAVNTLRAIEAGSFFDNDKSDIAAFCRRVVEAADQFLGNVKP